MRKSWKSPTKRNNLPREEGRESGSPLLLSVSDLL
nr:MAG TPA_asm: hypothetical protein [Caudoviricetes sp.]